MIIILKKKGIIISRFYIAHQTPSSVQFGLEGLEVLKTIPVVELKRDDISLNFSPMATKLLSIREIERIRIEQQKPTGKQFITISQARNSNAPLNAQEIGPQVAAFIKSKRVLDEAGLLQDANAGQPDPSLGKFGSFASGFMRDQILPTVRERTGHTDAEIRVIRLYSRDSLPIDLTQVDGKTVDLGVTLHNSCATCSVSVLSTLNFAVQAMRQQFFQPLEEKTGGKKMGGFIVLPTQSGSPSFSFKPPM